VEWPAKRSYVSLVAVGVQEQAEDIPVPPLLRNCLTFNYIPLSYSHYLSPKNSGPCNSFYCLGHFKMSMMMMMIIFIATIMVAYIGARTAEKLDGDLIKWAGSINLSINQSINQSIYSSTSSSV